MRNLLIALIALLFIGMVGCDKTEETSLKKVTSSSQIDTVLLSVDTLHYFLGSFDKQEGLTIVKEPLHAKVFELPVYESSSNDQQSAQLIYTPQDNFLGMDSVMLVTKRTILGEDSFVKLDTVLFVISTVKNDFHKMLIGKWVLKMQCGGFMGTCDSVKGNNFKIEFDYNMKFIQTYRDTVQKTRDYYLVDSLGYHYVYVNEISTTNIKYKRRFKYNNNNLSENPGDFYNIYYPMKK